MQFTINSKQLLSALSAVGRVVPTKAAIQILANFLIEVNGCTVKVTASDTENRATAILQADGADGNGKLCIEARFLTNVIKTLPDCPVTITVEDNGQVAITTDKNTFNAIAMDAELYPASDFNETVDSTFTLPTEILLGGLSETQFAVGTDDFHPQMMGVFLDVKPEQVVFVATDTRQLVKSAMPLQTGITANCTIPQKAISAVIGLAAKEPNITISIYPTAIQFKAESFDLRCQLIKGVYPPYERVIPQNNNVVATFNRVELLNAVRRVSACADSQYALVRLDFDADTVLLTSQDTSMGRKAKENATCEYSCEPMSIGFSANLLANLLSAIPTENVVLKLSGSSRPALIQPTGDDQHLTMLLMPMNINL